MSRIDLTIKTDYLPEWGSWEGIRELVQNAKDAETEFGAGFDVTWRPEDGRLRLTNEGCTLDTKAMLFGHTTKAGSASTIGQFGEGLKLGVLALVRAGHSIKIRTGSEVWEPSIQHSDQFDCNVLSFKVTGGRAPKNRVSVEIDGVYNWPEWRERFTFLADKQGVNTRNGTLYEGRPGDVYVKGIWVMNEEELLHSYNFLDVKVDRDRNMVYSWDIRWATKEIWLNLLAESDAHDQVFYDMLKKNAPDVRAIDQFTVVDGEGAARIAGMFLAEHGPDAFPARDHNTARLLGHLGKQGVAVPLAQYTVLSKHLGDAEVLVQKLSTSVKEVHKKEEIPPSYLRNFNWAVGKIKDALYPFLAENKLNIVSFNLPRMMGMYRPDTGRVEISLGVLTDKYETLRVLVHELAHYKGGDGTKEHVAELERSWRELYAKVDHED